MRLHARLDVFRPHPRLHVQNTFKTCRRQRWRAATDRKRLTHAAEEEEGINTPLGDEDSQGGEGAGEGMAPPGAMPTGLFWSCFFYLLFDLV